MRGRFTKPSSLAWERWYQRKANAIEPELPRLVMLLKRKAKASALDVGCGIGRHVVYLARNGIDTYGFDLSEKAISEAETLLKKEGVKAHLSVGDMFKRFPFGNGFFDAVVATRTLHHGYLREIRRAIREIDRVVSDGGYVFVQSTLWSKGDKIQNPKAVEVEPRTLIWSDGEEANIPHHFFTKEELIHSFENYEILNLHAKTEHYGGWCLLAKKKTQHGCRDFNLPSRFASMAWTVLAFKSQKEAPN